MNLVFNMEKNKVKVNMIVRVINVSGEKLLNAQIKDNISGAKIQVDSMEANKEKTYEILQNVNNSTKLDLELLEYEVTGIDNYLWCGKFSNGDVVTFGEELSEEEKQKQDRISHDLFVYIAPIEKKKKKVKE